VKGLSAMCIYCGTNKYRKIYENHHGPIPKDAEGRTYEIHHIDGNHKNNNPNNLVAVSIHEHYNIHYSQGDWAACLYIKSQRMDHTPDELSNLAKMANMKRVESGNHHWVGGEMQRKRMNRLSSNGTHPFLKQQDGTSVGQRISRKRMEDGTHNWLGESHPSKIKSKNGTHHFMKRKDGTSPTSDRVLDGTHPFLNGNKGNKHPMFDHTVYTFINTTTNTIETTTQYELRKKYNLNSGNLSEMMQGRRKSVSGWRLKQ
jgi:hypothetical protein